MRAPTDSDRVLIVEDEALIQMMLAEAFETEGFAVDTAGTCAAARQKMRQADGAYRAVVLDIGLPDGRGDALCDELRAINPDLPVVMCTAFGLGEIVCESFASGGVVVVSKPFIGPALLEAFRAATAQMARSAA